MLADGSVYPQRGRISFADASFNTDTGTYLVRAEVPNREGTLRPGQFVRARLRGAERTQAIAIPQQAVLQGDRGAFASGLHAGDRVVVENVIRVSPDAPLKAVPASTPAAGSQTAAGASQKTAASANAPAEPGAGGAAAHATAANATNAGAEASSIAKAATTTDASAKPRAKPSDRDGAAPHAVVLFDRGSSDITAEAAAKLAPIVAQWHDLGEGRAAISGYVDASGSNATNLRLAEARAKSVRAALIVAGIPTDRIEMRAPSNIVAGETADARRVEISLIGDGRPAASGDRR